MKIYIKNILLFTFAGFLLLSCGDKGTLTESTAKSVVEDYLKTNPIYETTSMEIGEIKFNARKEAGKLKTYKELADKGYIELELEKQKKKFLSKDSIYTYKVRLTEKASPYVFKQKKEKAEVKSFEYVLDEKSEIKIGVTGKRNGTASVSLKKVKTDFAPLTMDNNPHASFMTKTFKLKFRKDEGWEVVK